MQVDIALRAQDEVVDLLQDTLIAYPPKYQVQTFDAPKTWQMIGSYLVMLGYCTPLQIVRALDIQYERIKRDQYCQIGDILVEQNVIVPHVLSAVLLLQMIDRLIVHEASAPRMLGETLLVHGYISPRELAEALRYQIEEHQKGNAIRLGDILLRQGVITSRLLQEAQALHKQYSLYAH
jgi:hypothetical protein